LKLNREGYIVDWLVSGPAEHPIVLENDCVDNLAYEKKLRAHVRDQSISPPDCIELGGKFLEYMPWRYHFTNGNWMVQVGTFKRGLSGDELLRSTILHHHGTVKTDICAASILRVESDMEVKAVLWTYASVDVWVNGEHTAVIDPGAYKPCLRKDFTMKLCKGENQIFVRLQGMGTRDARNIFGVQVLENAEQITVLLPDWDKSQHVVADADWLRGVKQEGQRLVFAPAPETAAIDSHSITGQTSFDISPAMEKVRISVGSGDNAFARTMEFAANFHPQYVDEHLDDKANALRYYKLIGKQEKVPRGPGVYFATYNVLARYFTGDQTHLDVDLIYNDLHVMECRYDCSEFISASLLRLAKEYDLGPTLMNEMKRVFLGYRYWMDERGSDGMCFWSENHAIMFFGVQLVAGEMWPDELFRRSGRTGREQFEVARKRCNDWLDDVIEHSCEEFLSANYMNVTMGALLLLIDYGPEEISRKATIVLDKQFEQIGIQTFCGSVISPQGRVYRSCIRPFDQDSQGMLGFIDDRNAYAPHVDNWWLSALATSKYQPPYEMSRSWMYNDHLDMEHWSGNALIAVRKRKEYMLTGVQCPSGYPRKWENRYGKPDCDPGSAEYVKSLNEKFHGTSYLTPGQYGYMQHFFYAALSNEAVLFLNNPGAASEDGSMRPGYWYSNGVMPAQKQQGALLGQIYDIGLDYPINFVHLYFPECKFDEAVFDGQWLFARKGEGYVALWSSDPLEPHADMLTGCEWRTYERRCAFMVHVGSLTECGSFEDFKAQCLALNVQFDRDAKKLTADGFELEYIFERDDTQYLG